MKKLFLILTILFSVLTFIGAGYVLSTNGTASAGFAVIPMLFTSFCLQAFYAARNNGRKK